MIEQWMPLGIAIVSAIMMLCSNYYLQRKILTIHNKEKMVGHLVDAVTNINKLYMQYWQNNKHDDVCSLKIRIQQTSLSSLLTFSNKKYKFVNKDELNSHIKDLFMQATGDEFDSKERTKSNPDKCIKISKFINEVIKELMHNKI